LKTTTGERTLGSAEILEFAPGVLSPVAVQHLKTVVMEFMSIDDEDMDEARFEEFTAKCHGIIAKDGGLHITSIAPATRDFLPKLGLRDGWKEALQALAREGVPTFIFSSGYGDVIAQVGTDMS
jgi:hypothetical protein